MNPARYP